MNSYIGFDKKFAEAVTLETGHRFEPATNKFEALATNDALVEFHGTLNTIAASLMKVY